MSGLDERFFFVLDIFQARSGCEGLFLRSYAEKFQIGGGFVCA